jgi:uncharacterized protein YegL
MGWASYREDIVSRFVGAMRSGESVRVRAEKTRSVGGQGATGEAEMSNIKEFSVSPARPLPVVVLADVSGSMAADGKIDALNAAVGEMLAAFSKEDNGRAAIHVAVVTFGGEASLHIPLTPADQIRWAPMEAKGRTPLGAAFDLATELLEDREKVPARAYRPTIVLVSDCIANDEWRGPLARLLSAERAKKAQRTALAIGADADHEVLRAFLADPEARILQAHEAREIPKFFRWVTMSVASRSRSVQPNQSIDIDPLSLDDYGDF